MKISFENICTEFSRFYGIRKMNSEGQKRLFPVRGILITIVVGMILIAVPALAGAKQIKNTHTIIVGTELDYPPYSFLDEEGKPSGYNVELTRAIAEVMGLNVEIQIGPWGDIRHGLGTGKVGLISGMYYSKERDKSVDFSSPYTIVHHAIFARRDSPKIKSEADLRGREIIVMRGDIMHDYVLTKGLSKSPVPVDTPAEALRLLASGKYDYALTAKLPGLYWVKKLGLSNIEIVGPLMRPSAYCYAVKEGNTELLGRFNEGLAIIKETGQIKEIYDKWLGVLEPRGIPKGTILKYGGLSLLALLLILAGSVVWFRTLRSQVAQRTAELEKEINERKQAENELKDSEERYRALFDRSFELVYLCDFEGNFIDANNATLELLGYTKDDIKSMNFASFLDEDQLSGALETVEEILKTGSQRELAEYKLSRRNGEYIYVESKGAVIYREGEPYAIQGIARDITQRKRAEEALQESEKKLRIRNRIANIFLTFSDDKMYGEILGMVLEAMKSKYGVFGYIDENSALVCPSMTRDIWDQCQIPDKDVVFPRDTWGGIWGRALIEKTSIYSNESFKVPEGHVPVKRALDVPIIYQGEVIGNFLVGNKETNYVERDQELLEEISEYIAPVLSARLQRDKEEKDRKSVEKDLRKK